MSKKLHLTTFQIGIPATPEQGEKTKEHEKLFDRYERELLSDAAGRQTVELIAKIAERTPVSIGCFCEDDSRCHRSRLYRIIQEHAKNV